MGMANLKVYGDQMRTCPPRLRRQHDEWHALGAPARPGIMQK
jgi:hypothetical protein